MSDIQKAFVIAVVIGLVAAGPFSSGYLAEMEEKEALTREGLVEMVLQTNPELAAARKALDRAAAGVTQSRVSPNPELEMGMATDALTTRQGEGSLSMGISREFVTGGKRDYRVQIAGTEMERTRLEIEDLKRLISAEARRDFAELLFIQERIRLQEEAVHRAEEWVTLTEGMFRSGYVPEFDVNLAKIELRERVREREDLTAEKAGIETRVNGLIGRSPTEPGLTVGSIENGEVGDIGEDMAPWIESADRFRPDLQSAQTAVEAARLRLALAKALRRPDLRLSLDYTYDVSFVDLPDGPALRDRNHLLGGKISVPLMVSDTQKGAIEEAVAEEARAELEYRALRTKIHGEVVSTYQTVRRVFRDAATLQERILPLSGENQRLTEGAYRQGKAGILEVMEARRRDFEARVSLLEAKQRFSMAIADLEKTTAKIVERSP
jgi:cobalt-zinc-cadmium efflux system outer membrane protein